MHSVSDWTGEFRACNDILREVNILVEQSVYAASEISVLQFFFRPLCFWVQFFQQWSQQDSCLAYKRHVCDVAFYQFCIKLSFISFSSGDNNVINVAHLKHAFALYGYSWIVSVEGQ